MPKSVSYYYAYMHFKNERGSGFDITCPMVSIALSLPADVLWGSFVTRWGVPRAHRDTQVWRLTLGIALLQKKHFYIPISIKESSVMCCHSMQPSQMVA